MFEEDMETFLHKSEQLQVEQNSREEHRRRSSIKSRKACGRTSLPFQSSSQRGYMRIPFLDGVSKTVNVCILGSLQELELWPSDQ